MFKINKLAFLILYNLMIINYLERIIHYHIINYPLFMKLLKSKIYYALLPMLLLTNVECKVGQGLITALMPDVSEDAKMGMQVSQEIDGKPSEYPLLPENGNQEVYSYVRGITNKILNSGAVKHRNEFPWTVKIINDNKTLNAFCTPGGYIYVYTGLIKYLDSEDQLAGVMGHEIAHADNRHSMRQMVQSYGVQALLGVGAQVATRNSGSGTQQTAMTAAQVTSALVGLKFSREHETDADNTGVHYLCGTDYNAAGCAGFFEKIGNSSSPPEWLSTHPSPANRVQNIHEQAKLGGCTGTNKNQQQYQRIKQLLR
jgi:beta-barrel assembly-enhancing protease